MEPSLPEDKLVVIDDSELKNQKTTSIDPSKEKAFNPQKISPETPPENVKPFLKPSLIQESSKTAQASRPVEKPKAGRSDKNWIIALLLCIFLGMFGAHQFYAGRKGLGFVYLFTVGLLMLGWIVDFVLIVSGNFKDKNGRLISPPWK
ncbi:MAG: TM2 domain-containing protein [Anaerolineaceae bacterium]|nr:TM2 domain-containing protein [Anaerolineaceae bacterium]